VGRVRYVGSQPWPFPSSLMLGCLAEAESDEIEVDSTELADARWFEREAARRALRGDAGAGLVVPPPLALAHHLVREWAEGS
jgi:NAD+ diphosphatase